MSSLDDEHLIKYVNKNTELKIVKNILNTRNNTLQLKKKTLKEKHKELVNY